MCSLHSPFDIGNVIVLRYVDSRRDANDERKEPGHDQNRRPHTLFERLGAVQSPDDDAPRVLPLCAEIDATLNFGLYARLCRRTGTARVSVPSVAQQTCRPPWRSGAPSTLAALIRWPFTPGVLAR